jgi:hypothetical protein
MRFSQRSLLNISERCTASIFKYCSLSCLAHRVNELEHMALRPRRHVPNTTLDYGGTNTLSPRLVSAHFSLISSRTPERMNFRQQPNSSKETLHNCALTVAANTQTVSVVAEENCGPLSSSAVALSPTNFLSIAFSTHLILPAALGPGVYSASTRNEYQEKKNMFLGSRAQPVRRAHNFTAICEPIV